MLFQLKNKMRGMGTTKEITSGKPVPLVVHIT